MCLVALAGCAGDPPLGDEVIVEPCISGQAVHTYQLGSEVVVRTVRGIVHEVAQGLGLVYEYRVDVQATDAGTNAFVLCGAEGNYVEFVREQ